MGKELIIIFALIILSGLIHAGCESNQIDINSAPAEDLDKIVWVGNTTAQKIINARPFNSIEDLLNISGIGDKKLQDIKTQALACVEFQKESPNKESSVIEDDNSSPEKNSSTYNPFEFIPASGVQTNSSNNENITRETIILSSQSGDTKNIKIKENVKTKSINYSLIGLILFSVLIVVLLLFKRRKYENEFKE